MTRVIYTESHDDVANDFVRVPEAIAPGDAGSWWSKKRATSDRRLVLTAPGIPMLFQGQELLDDRWFDDTVAFDWSKAGTHEGMLRLHRDLIALRRAVDGSTRGLRGANVEILRADHESKVIAFHRWHDGGPGDDVVVIANLADRFVDDLRVGFPAPGRWRVRFNSDSIGYAPDFGGHEAFDTDADGAPLDGQGQSALVAVGPYTWSSCRARTREREDAGTARERRRRHIGGVAAGSASEAGRRADVLVEAEQVRRVVAALDLGQPAIGGVGIGLADPGLALVLEEVRVDPGRAAVGGPRSRPAVQASWTGASAGSSNGVMHRRP